MDKPQVQQLFLDVFIDFCKREGSDARVRLPFNCSVIADRMIKLSGHRFHLSNTPYAQFSDLVKDMVNHIDAA